VLLLGSTSLLCQCAGEEACIVLNLEEVHDAAALLLYGLAALLV
jgi:hypothetical protein